MSASRLAFAFVFLAIFATGVFYYGAKLNENRAWIEALSDWPETRLVERSFEIISDKGLQPPLIRVDARDDGEIALQLASCEERVRAEDKRRRAALELLCNSPYGETIRDDVEAWNAAYHLIAVRDTRAQDGVCVSTPPTTMVPTSTFPAGCKPPHWRIARRLAGDALAAARLLGAAAPPRREFGAALGGDDSSAYQGDWAMVDGGRDEGAQFVLNSEGFRLARDKPVTIEAVARAHGGGQLRFQRRAEDVAFRRSPRHVQIRRDR